MNVKAKLAILELVGGIFGWLWIVAGLAALVCFLAALFFGWPWTRFFWALGISVVSKWLLRGFLANQTRIAAEAKARGELT